jgi:Protein of unknown function (DUF4232)
MQLPSKISIVLLAGVSAALGLAGGASAATVPRCTTSGLVVWLDTHPGGTAGSLIYRLELTNLSGRTCSVFGYPGVSAVDLAGRQLGSSATRDHARVAHTVTLRNGHTAVSLVRIVNVGNFPSASCGPVMAAGLRVFPPNSATSKIVPFPFRACSRTAPTYLFVRVVQRA